MPQICIAARNCQQSVYTLLIKEIANTHSKCIRDLMQASNRDIPPTIYPIVHCLPTDINQFRQLSITHVFFIITLRRFNCDSYIFCFIVVCFSIYFTQI